MKYLIICTIALFAVFNKIQAQTNIERLRIVDSLYKLPNKGLFTEKNLEILGRTVSSTDKAFTLYFPDGSRIDSALGKQHDTKRSSGFIVTRVIGDEEIWPEIDVKENRFRRSFAVFGATIKLVSENDDISDIEPNWSRFRKKVREKYNSYFSRRAVLVAQMDFFRLSKNYDQLAVAYISYIREFPSYTDILVNETAWSDIFPNVTNHRLLIKSAKFFKPLLIAFEKKIGHFPTGFYDTYANLLYKGGKVEEAIACEEDVINRERNESFKKEFVRTLEKMKMGLPTWPEKKQ